MANKFLKQIGRIPLMVEDSRLEELNIEAPEGWIYWADRCCWVHPDVERNRRMYQRTRRC